MLAWQLDLRSVVMWMACVCLVACGGSSANAPSSDNAQAGASGTEAAAGDERENSSDSAQTNGAANKCERLSADLCRDLGTDADTCGLVRERTAELPEDHCGALLLHYEEVLADLKQQAARNRPLSPEQNARLLQGASASHGPDNARVTLVLFSDFQCPFCAGAADATHTIRERYGDKVRLVFRQFPLPFHRNAHLAAEASLAAHAQGKFWPMHDLLFAHQGDLERDGLVRLARQAQLDMTAFERALDQHSYAAAVDADLELGIELGVNGTPTMFLNGTRVANPSDTDAIAEKIDQVLDATP